jgi:uncharacterized protein
LHISLAHLSSEQENEGFTFNDIDIALYLAHSFISQEKITYNNLVQFETKLEIELEEKLQIPVDVRIINYSPLPFKYNVIKSGILAVDKDLDLRADFEGLTFKKYFEYVHLRDEYLRNVKNASF